MSWWTRDNVTCQVCPTAKEYSLMDHVGSSERGEVFWCPLCGSLAELDGKDGEAFGPISGSDFTAPYVAYAKDMVCKNGGNRLRLKRH